MNKYCLILIGLLSGCTNMTPLEQTMISYNECLITQIATSAKLTGDFKSDKPGLKQVSIDAAQTCVNVIIPSK
jgi:hypothetical protein